MFIVTRVTVFLLKCTLSASSIIFIEQRVNGSEALDHQVYEIVTCQMWAPMCEISRKFV